MNHPTRLALLVLAVATLGIAACGTSISLWTPTGGGNPGVDHATQHAGVVVHVQGFGVLDGWGNPTAKLLTSNGGRDTVTFDLALVRLDVDGTQFPPSLEPGKTSIVTLAPGENHETQLVFVTTLPIQPRDGTDQQDMQVLTQEMHLHLAPLMIDGQENPLPTMIYSNPDP